MPETPTPLPAAPAAAPSPAPTAQPLSAEERQKQIDSKTTFGSYLGFTIPKMAIAWGSLLTGGFLFYLLGSTKPAKRLLDQGLVSKVTNASGVQAETASKWIFASVGTIVGSIIGGTINRFDLWKKSETERLTVNNVDTDIARLMQDRNQLAGTLNRQEAFIQGIVGNSPGTSLTEVTEQRKGLETDRSAKV